MPLETQGNVSYSENPSGVGNVIFSQPVDLLALQQKQGDDLTKAIQFREQKNLAKRKIANDLVGDLKLDFEGIVDTDAPYFKQKAGELATLYSQAIQQGQDPSNPAFTEANTKFQSAMNGLMAEVKGSKAQKALLTQVASEYDPTKHDDVTLKQISDFRMSPNPVERAKIKLGVSPKKFSYAELAFPILKEMKPEIENLVSIKGGILSDEKTTTYLSDKRLDDFVSATGNLVDKAWNDSPLGEQQKYLAQQMTNGIVDEDLAIANAKKQYAKDQLQQFQAVQKDLTVHGETEAQKQGVKLSAKAKEGSVLPINISTFTTGDPKFNKVFTYDIGADKFADGTPIPQTTKAFNIYGTQSLSWPIGEYNSNEVKKYTDGTTEIVPSTKKPNAVEVGFHTKDGGYAIQTTESKENYLNKLGNTPFIFFKTSADAMQYVGTKIKASGDQSGTDVLGGANLFLQQTNNGGIGGFDPFKVHPLTKEEIAQRDEALRSVGIPPKGTQPAQKETATKIDYSKYPKSSDGKWYYDGKEWKAIN